MQLRTITYETELAWLVARTLLGCEAHPADVPDTVQRILREDLPPQAPARGGTRD